MCANLWIGVFIQVCEGTRSLVNVCVCRRARGVLAWVCWRVPGCVFGCPGDELEQRQSCFIARS